MTRFEPNPQTASLLDDPSRPSVEAPAPAEIDVEDVIRHLSGTPPAGPALKIGLECDVRDVDPTDRDPVLIDACPVCGNQMARPTFMIPGLSSRLVTCTDCRTGRLYPCPGPDEIQHFYPPEYYGVTGAKFVPAVEWLVRVVGGRHSRAMTRGLPPNARVLDVGCGRGVLLSAMADAGFEVHGFEISQTAVAGADPRAQVRVAPSLADAGYPAGYFDQVMLWHVLEHLPNPREVLTEIRRILAPGGRLIVAVPNFSSLQGQWSGSAWFHLDLPRHLFHFPLSGLCRLLDDCGFLFQSEHHFSLRQNPFGWVQSALNRITSLPRNSLYTLLKRSGGNEAPLSRWLRIRLWMAYVLGMPLGVLLSVVAALAHRGASVAIVSESLPADARCRDWPTTANPFASEFQPPAHEDRPGTA